MVNKDDVIQILDWLTTAPGVSFLVNGGDGSWQDPVMANLIDLGNLYMFGPEGEEDDF